jgi:tRNA dimethylallyltransferase
MKPPMAVPACPGNPGDKVAAILLAGPTASGKSALAMRLAQRVGGVVINADAMQTYRDLRTLTARPTAGDEALVAHALYGVRDASESGTVAGWRVAALAAMKSAHDAGKVPILCGGTGLYFAALTQGLAEIPDAGGAARAEARALLAEIGPAALHARLTTVDSETAARLSPADSQRIARAWEVWRGTGTGLAAWQRGSVLPPAPYRFFSVTLHPSRAALRTAIATRFDAMLQHGAVEEVHALMARQLDPSLPLMRAHGVPELSAFLRGELGLADAAARTIAATAAYTKRQATWFRHHTLAPEHNARIISAETGASEQFSESIFSDIENFIQAFG